MNKKVLITILVIVVFGAGGAVAFALSRGSNQNEPHLLDSFAQCLAEQGVTMYGAEWCPHCQNEKNQFGNAFRFVPYIECPKNPKQCLDQGVAGYPTWIFRDGRKLAGEQGVRKLSEESGCSLPEGY